jgi:hypothetical protein
MQRPIRMRAVQITVGIDHFRFDPQAELQPQRVDALCQRLQPVGIFVRVGSPVTQPGAIMVAAPEPAIVQNEPLRSDGGGGAGEIKNAGYVVAEIAGFPTVQMHRARPHRLAGPVQPWAHQPVHLLHSAVAALFCHRQQQRRGGETFAGLQDEAIRHARRQEMSALVIALNAERRIARPGQLRRQHEALIPAGLFA